MRWFMYFYCLRLKTDLSSDSSSSENEDGNKFSAISSPSAVDDNDDVMGTCTCMSVECLTVCSPMHIKSCKPSNSLLHESAIR